MKSVIRNFLLLSALFYATANAKSPVSVLARGGWTFPSGYFKKGLDDPRGGLALNGNMFSIGAGYDYRDYYRVTLEYQQRNNPMDEDEIRRWANSQSPGIAFGAEAGSWKMNGVLAGISMYLPIRTDFIAGCKIGFGVFQFKTPETKLRLLDEPGTDTTLASQKSTSGAFNIEFELGYRFAKHHAVTIHPEYFIANPTFKANQMNSDNGEDLSQQILTLGVLLQYAYHF